MPGSLGSYKAGLGGGGPWRVHSLIVGFKDGASHGAHRSWELPKGNVLRVKVAQVFLLPEQAGDGDVLFCFYSW